MENQGSRLPTALGQRQRDNYSGLWALGLCFCTKLNEAPTPGS